MKTKKEYILLAALLLFSLVIRLWEFDPWYSTNDPWIYYENAVKVLEGDPALHMWVFGLGYPLITALYFVVFGVSANTACIASAVSGTLSVLLVYLIGKEFFDKKAGLLSAFIFSLSPIHVHLSSTILSEATALFFSLLSVQNYIKFRNTKNVIFLYTCTIFTAFTVMARQEYWAIVFIYLTLGFINSLAKKSFPQLFNPRVIAVVVLFITSFSPQLMYNLVHFGNPVKPGYLDEVSQIESISIKNAFTTGPLRPIPTALLLPHTLLSKYVTLPSYLLFFYLIGLFSAVKNKKYFEASFLVFWFITFSSIYASYPHAISFTRYTLPLILPLSLLAGAGVIEVSKIFLKKEAYVFLTLFILLYSTTVISAFWLRRDAIKMHSSELDAYEWLSSFTYKNSSIFYAATFTNPVAQKKLGRGIYFLYDVNKSFVMKSVEKPGQTYFITGVDGNDRTKNGLPLFYEIRDELNLKVVKETRLKLSAMSPWRSYTLTIYKVSNPESCA